MAMLVLDEWLLTAHRIAIHLPTATAVAADLHLGYGRVRRRGGESVPTPSIAQEMAPVCLALRDHRVSKLVIAGDLFEDGRYQLDEMAEELLGWLTANAIELTGIVPGNHDKGLAKSVLPVREEGVLLGRWLVVHGHSARPQGALVQGHEHPWMRWRSGVEGPCYLVGDSHLVLPACSADAAGGNVLRQRRWSGYRCCVIAGDSVLDFGEVGKMKRSAQ
jgi:putative SbcD/Mre11-related phosphoesterase